MDNQIKSVDLIISTYNNPDALSEILERILKEVDLPNCIHIADDGSDTRTAALIRKLRKAKNVLIKHHWHENEGFRKCKILNQALSQSNSDYIIFLDGDCLPSKNFIIDHIKLAEIGYFVQGRRCFIAESHVETLIRHESSITKLIFTGKVSGLFKAFRFPWPIIQINQKQRGLIGCNWAAWRKDLLEINGFDEEYEGWGIGEDSDICSRLYNHGIWRKFIYGRAFVYHLNHPVLEKKHVKNSLARLEETISRGKIKCTTGLVKE
jgi:glycosyltransferase involved in cell wall biosynthesis|tara:strand:+ start:712 stop:1506 length:795 start_codon:yes stop_codon:yes gene_type:complete